MYFADSVVDTVFPDVSNYSAEQPTILSQAIETLTTTTKIRPELKLTYKSLETALVEIMHEKCGKWRKAATGR